MRDLFHIVEVVAMVGVPLRQAYVGVSRGQLVVSCWQRPCRGRPVRGGLRVLGCAVRQDVFGPSRARESRLRRQGRDGGTGFPLRDKGYVTMAYQRSRSRGCLLRGGCGYSMCGPSRRVRAVPCAGVSTPVPGTHAALTKLAVLS